MTPSEAGIAFPARPPIPAGRGVGAGEPVISARHEVLSGRCICLAVS